MSGDFVTQKFSQRGQSCIPAVASGRAEHPVVRFVYLIKEKFYCLVELLESLLQSWVILPKNDCHKIHLAAHFPLSSLDYILLSVFVGVKPPDEKTITRSLLSLALIQIS